MNYFIIYLYIIYNYLKLLIYYIKATIRLNVYKHFLSLFFALKAGILKIPGNKFNPNGYIIDNPKLIKVSFINIICVLLYTIQKHDIKYQKNNKKIRLKIKKIKNFIFIHFFIFFDISIDFAKSFCFLIFKIFFSDRDNCFNIILITAQTKVEYITCVI